MTISKNDILSMLKLIYEKVEPFKDKYLVKNDSGTIDVINSQGDIVYKTKFIDVIATKKNLIGLTRDTILYRWGVYNGYEDSEKPIMEFHEAIRLENNCVIVKGYLGYGALNINGEVMLDTIYRTLKPLEKKMDGTQQIYYIAYMGFGEKCSGIINISSDGLTVNKVLSKSISKMLGIDYILDRAKANRQKSRLCFYSEVDYIEKCKCRLTYNGVAIGKKCYDDILPNRTLENFGLVKVINHIDGEVNVGIINTNGDEIIEPKGYSEVEVLNPNIFLCKKHGTDGYELRTKDKIIELGYKILGFTSLIPLPLVTLIIDYNGKQCLASYGNDGKLHTKIHTCMDIWEYINTKDNNRKFLIQLYNSYFYTNSQFKVLTLSESNELRSASSDTENWIKLDFSHEDDIL